MPSDDIVFRLMDYMPHHKEVNLAELMLDAAHEIERLREELEASKTAIRGWIEMLGEK